MLWSAVMMGVWMVVGLSTPESRPARRSCYEPLVSTHPDTQGIAISYNLHPAAFDELMPKTLATATVDRLLHHAHVCQTSGESVRLSQALTGRGVSPLS
jgi:DNA replication protein DnaC